LSRRMDLGCHRGWFRVGHANIRFQISIKTGLICFD
jgi:hypothetical protein